MLSDVDVPVADVDDVVVIDTDDCDVVDVDVVDIDENDGDDVEAVDVNVLDIVVDDFAVAVVLVLAAFSTCYLTGLQRRSSHENNATSSNICENASARVKAGQAIPKERVPIHMQ